MSTRVCVELVPRKKIPDSSTAPFDAICMPACFLSSSKTLSPAIPFKLGAFDDADIADHLINRLGDAAGGDNGDRECGGQRGNAAAAGCTGSLASANDAGINTIKGKAKRLIRHNCLHKPCPLHDDI